jgi:hypothetical protein
MLFHKCAPNCDPDFPAEAGAARAGSVRSRPHTVDLHCHVMVPQIERLVADRPQKLAEPEMQLRAMGAVEAIESHCVSFLVGLESGRLRGDCGGVTQAICARGLARAAGEEA